MSFLDHLLKDIELKWVQLGDISKIQRGASPRPIAKFITDDKDGVPWIKIGDTKPNYKYVQSVKQKITKEGAKKSRILKKGDFIMSNSMSFGRPYILGMEGAIHDGWASISEFGTKLNSDFLYYYLSSNSVQSYWQSKMNSGSVSNLNTEIIKSLKIPLPSPDNPEKSFEIQQRLVDVLDKLTESTRMLTEKLSKEHIARKHQFSYYQEKLFGFEDSDIDKKPLGEIRDFQRGKRFVKTDLISEGVPTIHYGEMYTHYGPWADKTISYVSQELVEIKKLRVAEKGDVVIVAAGETIEDIGQGTAWLGDEGAVIHDACFGFRSPLNPKFVAYFTRTRQFHDQIRKHIRTGKISAINSKGLSKAVIPIPSPEEQESIVSILDRFNILTQSISKALPQEIILREKQYDYYRDMLLAFPKQN